MNRHMVITPASTIRVVLLSTLGVCIAIRCGLSDCTTKKQSACIVTVGGLQDVRGGLVCLQNEFS